MIYMNKITNSKNRNKKINKSKSITISCIPEDISKIKKKPRKLSRTDISNFEITLSNGTYSRTLIVDFNNDSTYNLLSPPAPPNNSGTPVMDSNLDTTVSPAFHAAIYDDTTAENYFTLSKDPADISGDGIPIKIKLQGTKNNTVSVTYNTQNEFEASGLLTSYTIPNQTGIIDIDIVLKSQIFTGDLTNDGFINVADIYLMIQLILGFKNYDDYDISTQGLLNCGYDISDVNKTPFNVSHIYQIVSIILANN